jgi:hypothetical protein
MEDNRGLYIEESIVGGVKALLVGRVNELLEETGFFIPLVEFGNCRGGSVVVPVVVLAACKRSEKERIVQADAYTLTVAFAAPEQPEGERNCYAYAAAVATALGEDPTLGGVVDRAELTGKKYAPPQHAGTGGERSLTLTLRLTIE